MDLNPHTYTYALRYADTQWIAVGFYCVIKVAVWSLTDRLSGIDQPILICKKKNTPISVSKHSMHS